MKGPGDSARKLAAACAVGGGELSELYFARGKAIRALVSAAQGDFEPAAKFNAEAARGEQCWVAEGIDADTTTVQSGAAEALDALERWF
jgi:hypothetical protein